MIAILISRVVKCGGKGQIRCDGWLVCRGETVAWCTDLGIGRFLHDLT